VTVLGIRTSPPAMEAEFVSAAVGYFLVNILVFGTVIRFAFPIIVHGDGEDGIEEFRTFREWQWSYHRRMMGDEE
jgi:hypothetical protein